MYYVKCYENSGDPGAQKIIPCNTKLEAKKQAQKIRSAFNVVLITEYDSYSGKTTKDTYSAIMGWLQRRERMGGYSWAKPYWGRPAYSKYPNIAAELQAFRVWVANLADVAHVSDEIMAAVINGGESLSPVEIMRICTYLGTSFDYISSPVISLLNPNTRKGKLQCKELFDAISKADVVCGREEDANRNRISVTCEKLKHGVNITWAEYRWALFTVQNIVEEKRTRNFSRRSLPLSN
ncbi:MAG: hypothetical protein VB106_07180 [Clostridiaceae bacterium]|nr:hypothetical protein [Clostridiaceae bacterium]